MSLYASWGFRLYVDNKQFMKQQFRHRECKMNSRLKQIQIQAIMKLNKNYSSYPLSLAVGSLLNAMDRKWAPSDLLFNDQESGKRISPDYRVVENEDSFEISYALPGYSKKQISLSLENSQLTVSGVSEDSAEGGPFGQGSFTHGLDLPATCDGSRISAKLNSGILKIVVPKVEKPKAIQIKVG